MLKHWVRNSVRAFALTLWLAMLGNGVLASSYPSALPATGASLNDLENLASTAAPAVRLAQAEQELATHRTGAAFANQGARLYGGTGISATREAVTDTFTRDYQRFNVQLGVRWPLLGSRDAQLRTARAAELAMEQGKVRLRQARHEAVQAVRRAYMLHLRTAQRLQITQAFLDLQPQAHAQLLYRRDSGVMLEAERLTLLGLFDIVQSAHESQRVQQEARLHELALLTDRPQPAIQTQPMNWPESCHSTEVLLTRADQYPPVVLTHLELNAWGQIAETLQHTGLEASVSVAQGFSRDVSGQNGRSTLVGVDFSMPLQWRAQRDAALGQIHSERSRLESLLNLRRSEFQTSVKMAQAQWRQRRNDIPGYLRNLQAAQEGLRVAALRLESFDGDGYAKLLKARYELYQASLQVVDGAERLDLAGLELLALMADECGSASAALQDAASPALAAAVGPSALTTGSSGDSKGLGWYVWDGQALLDHPTSLNNLPKGSVRILVSFTSPQLLGLTKPTGRKRMTQLISQAHAQGLRVELLLGEPAWVLPSKRQALLDLLAPLRGLPFDALHLDLERSQLPPADQYLWGDFVVDTLRAVRTAVAWPIALTTNFRELQNSDFAHRIHAAGVTELVAMVYVSKPVRASEIIGPLLQGPKGLRFAVAQSIEHELPTEDSSYDAGQAVALRTWHQLSQALETLPGFSGIVVQSWEEFIKAGP